MVLCYSSMIGLRLIHNLNNHLYLKEIEFVIKNLSTHTQKKPPDTDDFTGELDQTFKGEKIPIPHKLFQKIEDEGMLANLSNEATITPSHQKQTKKATHQIPQEHR